MSTRFLRICAATAALCLLVPTSTTAQSDTSRQRLEVGGKQLYFPPLVGEEYPDLPLVNANGDSVRLSSLQGKAILIQYIDMRNSICQAYAGSAEYGAIGEAEQLEDVFPLGDYMGLYGGGLAVDDPRMVVLHLLVRNLDTEAPQATDVSRWEARFGIEVGTNKAALGISPDLIPLNMDSLVPGFDLLDKDLRLVARSAAADSKAGPSRSFMKKVGATVLAMPMPSFKEPAVQSEPQSESTGGAGEQQSAADTGVFSLSDGDLTTYEPSQEEIRTGQRAEARNREAARDAEEARLRDEASRVQNITSADFTQKVIENPAPVLLMAFTASEQSMFDYVPVLREIAGEDNKTKYFMIEVTQDQEAVQGLEIKQVPTYILFRAGKQVSRKEGPQSKSALESWLRSEGFK